MRSSAARRFRRASARQQANIDQQKGPRVHLDVTTPIHDYKGKTLSRATGTIDDAGKPETADMILRDLLLDGLNDRAGETLTAAEKVTVFRLSLLVEGNDRVELTSDDVTFIKKRAAGGLTALGYGRVCELLDEPDESHGVETDTAATNGAGADVDVAALAAVD